MTAAVPVETTGDRVRRWRPTWRTFAVGLLLLVALVVLAVARPGRTGYLDPAAVDPTGSRALASLLADQGVRVTDVRTLEQLSATAVPGGAVLITDALLPTAAMVDDLLAAEPGRIVLVGATPGMAAFDRLAAGVEPAGVVGDDPLEPGCALPAATRAGSATLPGLRYDARAWVPAPGADGAQDWACYDSAAAAAVAVLPARGGRPEVVLLGSGHPLTNDGLDEQGNAALAMNLLGADPELAWWRPTPSDPALAGEVAPSPLSLMPTWVVPALLQALVATLLVAWWRGRRLGPIVVEPLPVVVPAGETTAGRARLLHAQHARGEAAGHLRAAACERLRGRLGLPLGASPDRLVAAAAARTHRPPGAVAGLLYGPEPVDDAALVRLEHDLGELVAEVGTLERGGR